MSAAHPGPLPFRLRNASGSCSVCFELAIYSLYYSYNEYIKIINCYNSDIMNIYTE